MEDENLHETGLKILTWHPIEESDWFSHLEKGPVLMIKNNK